MSSFLTYFCFHGPWLGLLASTVLSAKVLELEDPCEASRAFISCKAQGRDFLFLDSNWPRTSQLRLTLLQSPVETFTQEFGNFPV